MHQKPEVHTRFLTGLDNIPLSLPFTLLPSGGQETNTPI